MCREKSEDMRGQENFKSKHNFWLVAQNTQDTCKCNMQSSASISILASQHHPLIAHENWNCLNMLMENASWHLSNRGRMADFMRYKKYGRWEIKEASMSMTSYNSFWHECIELTANHSFQSEMHFKFTEKELLWDWIDMSHVKINETNVKDQPETMSSEQQNIWRPQKLPFSASDNNRSYGLIMNLYIYEIWMATKIILKVPNQNISTEQMVKKKQTFLAFHSRAMMDGAWIRWNLQIFINTSHCSLINEQKISIQNQNMNRSTRFTSTKQTFVQWG